MLRRMILFDKAFAVSLICISLFLSSCMSYRNMRPTGSYTTLKRTKIKEVYVFKTINLPVSEKPLFEVEFGKYPVYNEERRIEWQGEKKNIRNLSTGLVLLGGGLAVTLATKDSSVMVAGGVAVAAGVIFLSQQSGHKWESSYKHSLQNAVVEDEKQFEPVANTPIRAFSSSISKDWHLTSDANGRITLDIAEIAPLIREGSALAITFQTLEDVKTTSTFSIPSKFFADLKTYHASILPPKLITSLAFDDATSWKPNKTIDGAENVYLIATVENHGKGKALGVKLRFDCNQPKISIIPNLDIGIIEPGQKIEKRIPITADMDIADGNVTFTAYTKEQRDYDAKEFQLIVNVRHLDKPVLSITSFTLNDGTSGLASGNGNGIVENGETVEITAFLKNSGVGSSINTTLNLQSISTGAEIRQGKVQLGNIAPGETKQGKVVVAIPRTFTGRELRLTFAARDTIGASQITKEHVLPMSTRSPVIVFESRFLDSRSVQVDEVNNGGNYVLEIVPRNEGQIGARVVQANVSASTAVLLSNSSANIGDLAAGATAAPLRFNFSLPRNYNSGPPQFSLRLSQADFSELTQQLSIPFRRKAPALVAREVVNTGDGNSEIQQGEYVDLDVVVENQGDLDAEGAEVTLDFAHTGIDFRERIKMLGRIPAGGRQSTRFSFLVKTGATTGPLIGQLRVRQADGFPSIDKSLNYTINAIGAQIVTVTPTVQPGAVQPSAPTSRTNTPPVVFLSPKNLPVEGKSYDPFVTLEIQIQDDKPMLGVEPEIRVNGRLQTKEQGLRGLGLQERDPKETDRKFRIVRRVELNEGLNTIEVRVYDSNNELGLESTQIEYLASRTDIWALVVGVGDYQNEQIEDLKYTAADAQSFNDFLRTPEGGSVQTDHIKLLLNREATRENILRDMEWIADRASENHLVIIYIAMHGIAEQGELYFLGHNSDPRNLLATGIKKSELESVLQRRLRSNKVVWFADACHSGSLGEDPQIALRASRASATNRLLGEIVKARNGLALFTSAQAAEYSQESAKWGGGHGVFTYYLLQGLRGAADRNKDNFVSVLELYDYVSRQVNEATDGKQNPMLRGDFDKELKLSAVK